MASTLRIGWHVLASYFHSFTHSFIHPSIHPSIHSFLVLRTYQDKHSTAESQGGSQKGTQMRKSG